MVGDLFCLFYHHITVCSSGSEANDVRVQRALQNSWAVVFAHAREDQLPSSRGMEESPGTPGGSSVRSN